MQTETTTYPTGRLHSLPLVRAYGVAGDPGSIETRLLRLHTPREETERFTGRIWLLTGTLTYSSAMNFAATFKHFGRDTVIGEKTGGQAASFGEALPLTLPHSGRHAIPHKKFYCYGAEGNGEHGVYPHYPTEAMSKALELTGQTRRKE